MSGKEQLDRWKADEQLTADELLAALIYARSISDPGEYRLDLAERMARQVLWTAAVDAET